MNDKTYKLMENVDKEVKDKEAKDREAKDSKNNPFSEPKVLIDESKGTQITDYTGMAVVERSLNGNVVEKEMRELWDIVAKSAFDKGMEKANVMRVPESGDMILFYQQRSVDRRPFVWRSELVRYPPICGTHLRRAIITGIAIMDSKRTGLGGEATIQDGGIGAEFVEIKLCSKWFRGYSFTIIIIGKYIDESSEANSVYQRFNEITNE